LIIPFVSLYVLRQRLPDLKKLPTEGYFPGLIFVVFALILFVVGHIAAEYFTRRLSFVLLLFGLVLFVEGKARTRLFLFPIALLFFAVPLPYILYDAVAFPLKLVASQISVFFFSLLGLPVFREGNVITLTHTTMEVVDACSGIRSLMTLLTLAFLLACFQHTSYWRRAIVLICATPIAVLANAVRVTVTGLLTKIDPVWGEGARHDFSGWLVFVSSFIVLAGISWLLQTKQVK
jgi:exosortase